LEEEGKDSSKGGVGVGVVKGGAWQKGKRIKDLLLSTDAAYVRDFL